MVHPESATTYDDYMYIRKDLSYVGIEFFILLFGPLQAEGAEGELQDLRRTLTQLRKKMAKQGSEMNDLQLHLESQQARNSELEKKQKK